jgi:hypothetical protein
MNTPQEITLNEETFTFLKTRRYGSTIYRGKHGAKYLRHGAVAQELKLQEFLVSNNVPVSQILSTSTDHGVAYFIEKSLGEKHYGHLFGENFTELNKIDSPVFKAFLETSEAALSSIAATPIHDSMNTEFPLDDYMEMLHKSFPAHSRFFDQLKVQLESDIQRSSKSWQHGDFNAHNIIGEGIIDFEFNFWGCSYYDFISLIMAPAWFPESGKSEFFQTYQFSSEEKEKMLSTLLPEHSENDDTASSLNLSLVLRTIFSLVGLDHHPLIQEFRYSTFMPILTQYSNKELNCIDWIFKLKPV